MRLATAFLREVDAKIGHVHSLVADRREPTYQDFVGLFPATTEGRQEAARAAGYGGPGEHRQGSRAWRTRRSFMERVRRWQTSAGQQRTPPPVLRKREAGIVRAQWRRESRPNNRRQVLRLMNRYGVTVTDFTGRFSYERRRRQLDRFAVGISPRVLQRSGFTSAAIAEALRSRDYDALAESALLAFGRAYGMGDYAAGGASDVQAFAFRLGFAEAAVYRFGTSSRPAGARRASGNKYRGTA